MVVQQMADFLTLQALCAWHHQLRVLQGIYSLDHVTIKEKELLGRDAVELTT